MLYSFLKKCTISAPVKVLSQWHNSQDIFKRIQPPWEHARIINKAPEIANGLEEHIEVKMGFFRKMWIARYENVIEGQQFCDLQIKGPFSYWRHKHIFHENKDETSILEDNISYSLPLGKVGYFFMGGIIKNKLQKMFEYRHKITQQDIVRHHLSKVSSKNILICGGTGLVGGKLMSLLRSIGHEVFILTRSPSAPNHIKWSYKNQYIDSEKLSEIDTVINLAGASIAGLWTRKYQQEIYDSRVSGTEFLVESLIRYCPKLKTFLSASGSGAYPLDDGKLHDESSPLGDSFLARLAYDWEGASKILRKSGVRVAHFRIGVVISSEGGALEKMLVPAKFCLCGPWGDGKQHMSWISINDLLDIFTYAVNDERYSGIINAVAAEPIEVNNFFKILGKVMKRPQVFRVPQFLMKLLPNDMGEEIFLADNRVKPEFLQKIDFQYRHKDLESCLRFQLGFFK